VLDMSHYSHFVIGTLRLSLRDFILSSIFDLIGSLRAILKTIEHKYLVL